MVIAFAPNTPPLLGCAEVMGEALEAVKNAQPIYLSTSEKAMLLRELVRVEGRVAELRMRVMAASGDLADQTGARDVASWLAAETRQDFREPRADQTLAVGLDKKYTGLRAALRDGLVNLAQARVIARALDDVPAEVEPLTRKQAERVLIEYADRLSPHQLRLVGRRILEVVAPELAEAEEAKRLQSEEVHARARTKLSFKTLGDGTTRMWGVLPDAVAHRFETYLHAFTNPRLVGRGSASERIETTEAFTGTYPRRLGQAFCQLLEAIDPKRLPLHGGDATTVVVTISLDHLNRDLGVGELIGADKLTASEVRRLACTAKIVPAVLGARSEVLDLGRGQRLFTAAQRKALLVRDQRCRAERCTIPGTWSEAHHWIPWSSGGLTNLTNGVLLCNHHHHRAHDPAYLTERLANGDVRFARRP